MISKIKWIIFLFVISSCVSKEYQTPPQALTVMTFNVENLFDNLDDPGKDDSTYLPIDSKKSAQHRAECQKAGKDHWIKQCLEDDWSDQKIKRKLKRLADVILQIKEGRGPDILILQEVENLNILERLRINYLSKAGYKPSILIEGPDERGIDVAMLSRLTLAKPPKLNKINLTKINPKTKKKEPTRPTRGILQAQFLLPDGQKLTVMGVHFPSQGAPTRMRKIAVDRLIEIKKSLPQDEYVVVGGDFNITSKEDAKQGYFHKDLSEYFLVSHQIGCDQCLGTHNYRGEWSFLDVLLFSKNFKHGSWKVIPKSIRLANKSLYQIDQWGGPARFRGGTGQKGVSDHFPVAADFVLEGRVQ